MKKIICLFFCCLFVLTGCGKETADPVSVDVYAVDSAGENINRSAKEVLPQEDMALLYVSETVKANPYLFPEGISVLSVTTDRNTLNVDFSGEISQISEEDFLYINELCALAASQGERQQGDKIAKVNLFCEGVPLAGYFQYPYVTRLVDMAAESNFPIWMLHLYFPNKENTQVIREYRLVPAGENNTQELILQEMKRGTEDPDHKNNIFPVNADYRSTAFDEETGIFTLNFTEELVSECTAGQETMLVQSVLACFYEFNTVKEIQLQINGSQDITIGDISLAQPLTPDWNYFDNPEKYFGAKQQ